MMHPIDLKPERQEDRTPGGGSVWWAVFVLVLVIGLVVAAAVVFADDGPQPSERPVPNEAPVEPGDTPGT